MDDALDDNHQPSNSLERTIEELAREGISSPGLLEAEISWLLCEDSGPAFWFACRLGDHDPARSLLPMLLKTQESLGDGARLSFLGGYLASIYRHSAGEWELLMLSLAEKPFLQRRFADLAISSGMSDNVARKVVEFVRSNRLDPKCLERWWFMPQLRQIDEAVFLELVDLQLIENRGDLWSNAVSMFHAYYLDKEAQKTLPDESTFRVLTWPGMSGKWTGNYYWSQVAAAFVAKYPERAWEFFRAILRLGMKQWNLLADLDMPQEQVLTNLLKSDPERAWNVIAVVLSEGESRSSFGIQHWLRCGGDRGWGDDSPGAIRFVPSSKLFAWVDEDIVGRGGWLIDTLPKTLDRTPAGRLTRDFVARYGKIDSLCRSLWFHFRSREWCGPASDYCRKLREEAREWLVDEKNQTVIRWTENYIDGLGSEIQRAEIEEERRL
jgi:hypothetical protein